MNSGICVKASCYDGCERDYYGILKEVIQLQYLGENTVVLFNGHWFDNMNGLKVDPQHGLIDVKHNSKLVTKETFVLAQQAVQVYYTSYPSKKKERIDWWAVCKTKARGLVYAPENEVENEDDIPIVSDYFQEDETEFSFEVNLDLELDRPGILHDDGIMEEVNQTFVNAPARQEEDEEEYEEDDESDEEEGDDEDEGSSSSCDMDID